MTKTGRLNTLASRSVGELRAGGAVPFTHRRSVSPGRARMRTAGRCSRRGGRAVDRRQPANSAV